MALEHALRVRKPANSFVQNEMNISIIFNYLRKHGSSYRAQISRDLSISAPAVSRAIEKLKELGYVVESEPMRTSNGKKAVKVSINVDKGFVLGIDVLKENLRIAAFDYRGSMVASTRGMHMAASDDVPRDLVREIETFLSGMGTHTGAALKAICVGVPAVVEAETSQLSSAILFPNLTGINLKEILTRRFNVPVFVENDVHLSALAENQFGQGRMHKDLVFLEVSAGIGAGIIIDNNVVAGHSGASGELGYMALDRSDLGWGGRTKGPLEQRASTDAIRDAAVAAMRDGTRTLISDRVKGEEEGVTPSIVAECALEGDPLAVKIFDDLVARLSLAVINLAIIIDPEVIVFGGDICSLPGFTTLLLEPIRSNVNASLPFTPPEITVSSVAEDAGVIGAAYFAIESLLLRQYPYRI
ncbi:MAG: ROK family transcriptional regulator [Spirochaetaceae bacterium]|nr:MAG: ROK family transcriptional regulator [Spirochaetaceae bacterium]